jgi:hypothetical protein
MFDDKPIGRKSKSGLSHTDYSNPIHQHLSNRRLNMNTKSKIAIAAVLFSAIASPSFAAFTQFGVGADPVTDGRYAPPAIHAQGAVYASAVAPKRSAWRTSVSEMQLNDRLAAGRL